jgi:hypothetical protein
MKESFKKINQRKYLFLLLILVFGAAFSEKGAADFADGDADADITTGNVTIAYSDPSGGTGLHLGIAGVSTGYIFGNDGIAIGLDQNKDQSTNGFWVYNDADPNNNVLFRVQEDGNVGIGETSPDSMLHIASSASGGANITLEDTSGGANRGGYLAGTWGGNGLFLDTLGADGHIYYGTNNGVTDHHHFYVDGTEVVSIDNGGNLGINVTNPLYPLQVHTEKDQNLMVRQSVEPVGGVLLQSVNDANSANQPMELRSSLFSFQVGNVGIGTSSPTNLFHILKTSGGSSNYVQIEDRQGAAYAAGINFSKIGASWYIGAGSWTGSTNYEIASDSIVRLMIENTTGNVGIGTTTPGSDLDIVTTSTSSYPLLVRGDIDNDGGYSGISFGFNDGANYQKARIHVEGTSGYVQPEMHFLLDNTGDSSDANIDDAVLSLLPSGNVGIGTTAPVTSLEIQGSARDSGDEAALGDQRTLIRLKDTTALAAGVGSGINFGGVYTSESDTTFWSGISGVKEDAVSGNYGGELIFQTRPHGGNMNTRMTIDSAGNVGIGTTLPEHPLEVIGADQTEGDATGAFVINSSAGDRLQFGVSSTNGYAWIRSAHPGVAFNDIILQPDGGNVGIRTESPDGLFVIEGSTANFTVETDGRTLTLGSPGAGDGILAAPENMDILIDSDNSQTTRNFYIYKDAVTGGNEIFTVQESGNVGIGTTAPTQKLNVVGGIVNISSTGNHLTLENPSGSESSVLYHHTDDSLYVYSSTASGGDKDIRLLTGGSAGTDTRIFIEGDNGNIGIGVNSPTHLLNVDGTSNFTGTMTVEGNFVGNGQFTGSSRTKKKDITSLDKNQEADILEQVKNLDLVSFRYKTQNENETPTLGVIAEESPEELLSQDKLSVNSVTYSTYALAGVKQLARENEILKQQIEELNERLNKLETQNSSNP